MNLTEVFSNSFKLMIETFMVAIPNFLKAIIVIAIGYFISKTIQKIIAAILNKVGVDKLGESLEKIDFVSKSGIKIKISSWIATIIYFFLLLIFLVAATDILQMQALSNLVSSAIEFIPNLIVAIVIMVVGLLGADKLKNVVISVCESLGITSGKMIGNFIFYFVFITVFIMALSQAKINTEFLATNLSIIVGGIVLAFSIGYGLASKDTVANFLAARYAKSKFNKGDKIMYGGKEATIMDLDADSMILDSEIGTTVVPMYKLIKEEITILK